jgi:hypothetical protein
LDWRTSGRDTWLAAAGAALCVLVDVYIFGLWITLPFLGVAALVRGGRYVCHLWRGHRLLASLHGRRAVIYALACALSIAGLRGNVSLAAKRGAAVAAAVKAYRARTGDYPRRLEDLVPTYLPEVPPSCIRISATQFFYHYEPQRDRHPGLSWIPVLPFGKGSYRFATDELVPFWD